MSRDGSTDKNPSEAASEGVGAIDNDTVVADAGVQTMAKSEGDAQTLPSFVRATVVLLGISKTCDKICNETAEMSHGTAKMGL